MREDCDSVGEAGSKDPGAARHGNFINYYTFNPPENRLKHIPDTLLANLGVTDSPICILDIGCNAGVGVSLLDTHFIANNHGLLQDLTSALFRSFGTADVRMLGVDLDQQLVDRAVQNFTVEDRLQFQHLDIMSDNFQQEAAKYLSRFNKTKFDLVTVFSVTMWVHLNLGDRGLEELVRRLVAVAACVLVEPQPWKCYQTAAR